jgi:ubiquinol-cytochrome c reductase cytochrome c subunit
VLRRHAPAYDPDTVDALVAFVGRLVADPGPRIPDVAPGDVAKGGEVFRENCAACHAWSGGGGALLHREAPPIQASTPVQTAEVVRVGSGQMPAFGQAALTKEQLDDLVSYVEYLDDPRDRGGQSLHHLGPVAEGAMSLVALGVVLLLCRWIGDRASE